MSKTTLTQNAKFKQHLERHLRHHCCRSPFGSNIAFVNDVNVVGIFVIVLSHFRDLFSSFVSFMGGQGDMSPHFLE